MYDDPVSRDHAVKRNDPLHAVLIKTPDPVDLQGHAPCQVVD